MAETRSLSVKLLTLFIFFVGLFHFINLNNNVPIFADEAIFLYQADKIIENPKNLLISLEEAQFPVMTWTLAVIHLATPKFDPLLTGRLLSVLADFSSAFFIFLIGRKLGNKLLGLFATILYLAIPLNFFHSRLALQQPLTNCFALLTVYFILLATQNGKFKIKYIFAIFISSLFAFFAKPLALASILPSLFVPIMFALKPDSFKINFRKLVYSYRNILLGLIPAAVTTIIFFLLIPNNVFSTHAALNFSEFKFNLFRSLVWLRIYITNPLLLFTAICALWFLLKRNWTIVWLSLWILSPVLVGSLFLKFFYPRHLFPISAPIALISAYGLYNLFKYKKDLAIILLIILLLLPLDGDLKIITNPKTVLAGEERQGFYEDWPSGVGLLEIAKNLKSLSRDKIIEVYVENEPLIAWALPNLFDIGKAKICPSNDLLWNRESFYKTLQNRSSKDNLYLILNHYPYLSSGWKFQLIYSYPKGPNRSTNLYKYTD